MLRAIFSASMKKRTNKEKEEERQVKALSQIFESRGVKVRRENLSRGPSFRVRSGDCLLTGERVVFLDKRLPSDQQINVLIDQLSAHEIELNETELAEFPKTTQVLIQA